MRPVLFFAKNAAHETREKKQKTKQQQRSVTHGTQNEDNWKPARKNRKPKRQEKNTNGEAPRQESANIKQS